MHLVPAFSALDWLPWCLLTVLLLLVAYLESVVRQQQRGHRWIRGRTALWLAGIVLLFLATGPPLAHWAHHSLRGHMMQHLLIGMLTPLGLVLAAPCCGAPCRPQLLAVSTAG